MSIDTTPNVTRERWHEDLDRYVFDFNYCHYRKGWAQIDTESDASYYGAWANPARLQVVTYTEGDICITTAASPEDFAAELRRRAAWHRENDGRFAIDPMGIESTEGALRSMGLSDLLH